MLAAALGSIVGLILGLTGAGGSIFAVPLLVVGLGQSMLQATPVALLAVGGAAALGALDALRVGVARYKTAIVIGACGSLTSPIGLDLAARTSHEHLVYVFVAVMLVVAVRMFVQSRAMPGEGPAARRIRVCRLDAATGRIRWTAPCALVLSVCGAATGVLSGALGVGAGFVIVPILRATTDFSMRASIATSLMAIAIISTSAVIAYLLKGGQFELALAVPFLAGALVGMLIGRRLAARIAGPSLQRLFAAAIVLAGAAMIYRVRAMS